MIRILATTRIFLAFTLIATALITGCGYLMSRDMPPIVGAARNGDSTLIEQLIRDGADPNVHAGVNDWTPLMHAIHKNQPGSVRTLLSNGARVNEANRSGVTALIMAAGYGYTGIVQDLLKAGADPRAKAANGDTALTAAVGGTTDIDRFTLGKCQTETVRVLVAALPDLKAGDDASLRGAMKTARLGGCSEVTQLVAKLRQ